MQYATLKYKLHATSVGTPLRTPNYLTRLLPMTDPREICFRRHLQLAGALRNVQTNVRLAEQCRLEAADWR